MKAKKNQQAKIDKAVNFAAIIATATEMARCLNKNLAKVHVAPLDSKLTSNGTIDFAKLIAIDSQS